MDEEIEVKVVSINCDDERTQLGFVFSSLGATYSDVRLEIKEDEITTSEFQMLSIGSSVFSSKQEEKMKLRGDVVHIKLIATSNGGTNKRPLSSMASTTSSEGDGLGNGNMNKQPRIQEPSIEAINVELDGALLGLASRLNSKLALAKDVQKWQHEILNTRRKIKKLGRHDALELETRDQGKSVFFHLFCHECQERYHRSGSIKPWDACANYLRSHINSDGHLKNYEVRHGLVNNLEHAKTNYNNDNEETLVENKFRVQEALGRIKLFEVEFPTSKFELVDATVGNYSRLGAVKIRCTVDNKWMHLFPKTGTLESNMREHVIGKSHHDAVSHISSGCSTKSDPKSKGRPSKPSSSKDPRQKDLSSFLVNVGVPSVDDSSTNDGVDAL